MSQGHVEVFLFESERKCPSFIISTRISVDTFVIKAHYCSNTFRNNVHKFHNFALCENMLSMPTRTYHTIFRITKLKFVVNFHMFGCSDNFNIFLNVDKQSSPYVGAANCVLSKIVVCAYQDNYNKCLCVTLKVTIISEFTLSTYYYTLI